DSHPASRQKKCSHNNPSHRISFPHAPCYETAKALVSRSRIDSRVASLHGFDLGKKFYPQIRRKSHGDDPRSDQGEADNPENISGIFSRSRTGKADRKSTRLNS